MPGEDRGGAVGRWILLIALAGGAFLVVAIAFGQPTAVVVFEMERELDRLAVPAGWSELGDVHEVLVRDVLADEVLVRRAWAAPGGPDRVCEELVAELETWPLATTAHLDRKANGDGCRGGGLVSRRGLWVRGEMGMLAAVDAEADTAFAGRDDRGPVPEGHALVTVQLREVRPSWSR